MQDTQDQVSIPRDSRSELPTGVNLTNAPQPEEPKAETARTPLTPEPPTEFQRFVEGSLGYRVSLFGYNLFQGVPSTFAPVDHVAVPSNYVIGPGDELLIRAWGQIDVEGRLIVDRSGQVYLPKVGPISVAGVPYERLADRVKESISRVFRNFDVTVSLGHLRSIQVFVVGYARRPGSYTVGSLSTLVNALFASGGPSSHGSLRHIEVKRGDQVVTDFDLYDLLLKGDKSKDVVLLPGDVIYIPPVGPQVAIAGSVNFPAIYELRGTTTLADELNVVGGISSVADGERVIVERVDDHSTRKVEEFRLDADGKRRELRDGDLVRVFSISPRFADAITLRGNVAEPGRYPFRQGMKIRDLVPNKEFLLTRDFWLTQNGATTHPLPDLESARQRDWAQGAEREDDSARTMRPTRGWTGNNNVMGARLPRARSSDPDLSDDMIETGDNRQEQTATARGQLALRNDVKQNAPDINWDYAVIQRLNPADLSTSLIPFNLGKAILENDERESVALQPGDVITIFSQRDISVPDEHQSKYVRLEGEFRAPGVYKVAPGETLRSLIARAGGLTDRAFLFGSQFTRKAAQKQQQDSLDRMVRDLETEIQHQSVYLASTRSDQQQNLQAQMESQRLLIERLRQVKATGRVVLDTKTNTPRIDSFPDVSLEDGDKLLVPREPATISVVGSVYNQTSFLFEENSRIYSYLKAAGGGTRDADLKHVFLVRANGSVLSKENTSGMWSGGLASVKALPGDTLVVPAKFDKGATLRAIKDWSQVIGQIGLGAAAINVLK